jgi:hypothetical protein
MFQQNSARHPRDFALGESASFQIGLVLVDCPKAGAFLQKFALLK